MSLIIILLAVFNNFAIQCPYLLSQAPHIIARPPAPKQKTWLRQWSWYYHCRPLVITDQKFYWFVDIQNCCVALVSNVSSFCGRIAALTIDAPMRPIAVQTELHGLSVVRSLCSELCKNGWTDRDAVCNAESDGPREPCIKWEMQRQRTLLGYLTDWKA